MLHHTSRIRPLRLRRLRQFLFGTLAAVPFALTGCVTMDGGHVTDGSQCGVECVSCAAPQCATCGAPHGMSAVPLDASWNAAPMNATDEMPACKPAAVPPPPEIDAATAAATQECEQRVEVLQQRLDALVTESREADMARDQSMQVFLRDLRNLTSELDYWKSEVQRLDAAAKQQHERDMQSLDALLELVSQIPMASADIDMTSSESARN